MNKRPPLVKGFVTAFDAAVAALNSDQAVAALATVGIEKARTNRAEATPYRREGGDIAAMGAAGRGRDRGGHSSGPRLVFAVVGSATPIEVRAKPLTRNSGQALHSSRMLGRHVAPTLPVGHRLLGKVEFTPDDFAPSSLLEDLVDKVSHSA